jgi:hypothetical protein
MKSKIDELLKLTEVKMNENVVIDKLRNLQDSLSQGVAYLSELTNKAFSMLPSYVQPETAVVELLAFDHLAEKIRIRMKVNVTPVKMSSFSDEERELFYKIESDFEKVENVQYFPLNGNMYFDFNAK